jgi:hypothetical protein
MEARAARAMAKDGHADVTFARILAAGLTGS